MSPRDERVWPRDCAFLISIPTTKSQFLEDLARTDKDFVRLHYSDVDISEETKWLAYKPTADDVEKLLVGLEKRNVNVVRGATLADWVIAQGTAKVIVLFTHWRSGLVRFDDVRWERLDKANSEQNKCGASEIVRLVVDLFRTNTGDRSKIVERLNDVLLNEQLGEHPWFGTGPNQLAASTEHRVHANRAFLDEAFPGAFGRSTSVELADGLVEVDCIADGVPRTFTGVLDLSVCSSVLLAEMIKARARNCLVVAPKLPALVSFRTVFYRGLFKLLGRGRPYVPAMEELRRRMLGLGGKTNEATLGGAAQIQPGRDGRQASSSRGNPHRYRCASQGPSAGGLSK